MTSTNLSPISTLIRRTEVHFSRPAPFAFESPRFYACNPKGDMVYAIRMNMEMVLDPETRELQDLVTGRTISQMHVGNGERKTYNMKAVPARDLRQAVEFYMLTDYIGVIVLFNRAEYELTQLAVHLNTNSKEVDLISSRKLVLQGLTFDIGIGLGRLNEGLILVTGSRGPLDGEREPAAYALKSDPLKPVDVNKAELTHLIREFEAFLKSYNPQLKIFANGIIWDKEGLLFMLKGNYNSIETNQMGRCFFPGNSKKVNCSVISIATSNIPFAGGISTDHLQISVQRGNHWWMVLTPPDFNQMRTFRWVMYLKFLPYIIKMITTMLELTFRLRSIDGGFTLKWYLRFLSWCNGPTMVPSITPPPIFLLYHMDIYNKTLRKVDCQARVSFTQNLHLPVFPVTMDCDYNGGLLFCELPGDDGPDQEKHITTTYYNPPDRPSQLSRLAAHKAYRLYPAFERSRNFRRMLGVSDYAWII